MSNARSKDHSSALDARFAELVDEFSSPIARLARGYEADESRRLDLQQEIWTAVWRALPAFEGRSSHRTWIYRIAHNVATTEALRGRRDRLKRATPLESVAGRPEPSRDVERAAEGREALLRLEASVRALRPLDRQLVLLFLEGFERGEIAEITGLSPENVSVRLSRLRAELAQSLRKEGGS
ncbi:RNA polymerase sigma factor [Sorangium sp. So ce854]|uniref:RNA polymerase sigma factor n=1 Tax=Sorangium sp. So ce854 TaxID=3133322 RepID=UPI003F638E50